jgi:hypothetical protein
MNVEFEVLTAVVMKSSIFWDTTPCSPLKVNRHFGGIVRLHLQGRRVSEARNQRESRWQAELFFVMMNVYWHYLGMLSVYKCHFI